jgi:hypothetical protein
MDKPVWVIEEDEAVLYGTPNSEHSCDEMGCPSIGHVLKVVDLHDDGSVMEAALDRIWGGLYKDGSRWCYPGQVAMHVNAAVSEYEDIIKKLKEKIKSLQTERT